MAIKINMPNFSGRIGNVIFYERNGCQIARIQAQHPKNPKTLKQLQQRAKVRAAAQWLSPIKVFLHTGFISEGKGKSYNRANKLFLLDAVESDGTAVTVNPAKVMVAEGKTAPAEDVSMTVEGHLVTLRWTDNSGQPHANSTDRLLYLFFDPEKGKMISNVQQCLTTIRCNGQCHVNLPEHHTGRYHVYLCFINMAKTEASNSVYLGEVTL